MHTIIKNKPTTFVLTHEPDRTRTERKTSISIIALTLTRSLGRQGVRVIRVHPNMLDHSLFSKYCDGVEICPNQYDSEDALCEFLIEMKDRYAGDCVLIPASDDCSLFLSRHEHALSGKFAVVNPSMQTMERLKNKRLQYELAESVGVPIPETWFPTTMAEVESIVAAARSYPYIIKPLEAQRWRLKEFKHVSLNRKAITVHNGKELVDEYQRIAEFDNEVMVQEVIGGRDDRLYTCLAYCSANDKPLAWCIRSKLRQSPIDFGYCTATVSCENPTVEKHAKALLRGCEYQGIVGIEFKHDKTTDQYKLIEINTRPVNTLGLSIGCGVDIPYIAYRDAIGEKPESLQHWQVGVTWLWFQADFWAARELIKAGRLTVGEWLKSLRGKRVHAIFASDDLRPTVQYYFAALAKQLRRQIRKFR